MRVNVFFGKIVLFFKILHVTRTTFRENTLDPRQSKNDTSRVVVETNRFHYGIVRILAGRSHAVKPIQLGISFTNDSRLLLDRSSHEPPFRDFVRRLSTSEFVSNLVILGTERGGRQRESEKWTGWGRMRERMERKRQRERKERV